PRLPPLPPLFPYTTLFRSEGGAAGVIRPTDSLEEHAHDTVSGGDWLCDQEAVEAFVAEAPPELLRLEHWGCPWSREPDGHVAVRDRKSTRLNSSHVAISYA